jgi:hypothetical protein
MSVSQFLGYIISNFSSNKFAKCAASGYTELSTNTGAHSATHEHTYMSARGQPNRSTVHPTQFTTNNGPSCKAIIPIQ